MAAITAMLLGIFACENPPAKPPEPRADQLSRALCLCANQLLLLNQAHATKSDSLSFREIFLEFEKTRACVTALGIKPEDRPALDASMGVHCPVLAAEAELLRELMGE